MLATQSGRIGHFGKFGRIGGIGKLSDAYCDDGYYYDPDVDNCLPAGEVSSICDIGWYWDTGLDSCQPLSSGGGTGTGEVSTDGGNSQIWAQIIAAAGKIGTQVIQATSTQYRTRYGTYSYGTGPYSGLNYSTAQQYLALRPASIIPGISNTTLIIGVAGLFAVMMLMRK